MPKDAQAPSICAVAVAMNQRLLCGACTACSRPTGGGSMQAVASCCSEALHPCQAAALLLQPPTMTALMHLDGSSWPSPHVPSMEPAGLPYMLNAPPGGAALGDT